MFYPKIGKAHSRQHLLGYICPGSVTERIESCKAFRAASATIIKVTVGKHFALIRFNKIGECIFYRYSILPTLNKQESIFSIGSTESATIGYIDEILVLVRKPVVPLVYGLAQE